jgi:hypothetical protein
MKSGRSKAMAPRALASLAPAIRRKAGTDRHSGGTALAIPYAVMLNLFQHPFRRPDQSLKARWMLKQVQHDECYKCSAGDYSETPKVDRS